MTKDKKEQIKKNKGEMEDLEKLFNKIENMKEFKEWFGAPCPEFYPLCANCNFWNKWEKLKLDLFQEMFQ